MYIHGKRAVQSRTRMAHLSRTLTTREYCHNVLAVEPKWLVEVAPQFFKVADANNISKRKRQEKIEPLYNKVMNGFSSSLVPGLALTLSAVQETGRVALVKDQTQRTFESDLRLRECCTYRIQIASCEL